MLQRIFIHLSFVLVFALMQIGVATHEISHTTSNAKHSQTSSKSKPKNTVAEQCAQCISYAKIASGVLTTSLAITTSSASTAETPNQHVSFQYYSTSPYSARAPPQTISS